MPKQTIRGNWKTKQVFINGIWLNPSDSQKIINHSPDGFNWGYEEAGSCQLALGILEHYIGKAAIHYYQSFKYDIIAQLPVQDFELKESLVITWLNKKGLL